MRGGILSFLRVDLCEGDAGGPCTHWDSFRDFFSQDVWRREDSLFDYEVWCDSWDDERVHVGVLCFVGVRRSLAAQGTFSLFPWVDGGGSAFLICL